MEEHTLALESYFGRIFSELHVEGKYIACVCDVQEGIFNEVIVNIFSSLLQVEAKIFCLMRHRIQLKRMSNYLERFRRMLLSRMPWEVFLSVFIGVGVEGGPFQSGLFGWEQPAGH